MGLFIRDHATIRPVLRDGAPTAGVLEALQMTGAGTYFTEEIPVGTFTELLGFVLTTAHAGSSPTLDITLQYGFRTVADNQAHWIDSADSFTQITTTDGISKKQFTANFGRRIRFKIIIGGTSSPSFTLTLAVAAKG